MNEKLESTARQYEMIAAELESATKHFNIAAQHFRKKEIPRGAAHTYAGWGHMNKADALLKSESIVHANNSNPEI